MTHAVAAKQTYERYKDSGSKWMGQVPANWEVTYLGPLLKPISEKNQPDLPLLSITREQGVIIRDVEDQDSNHNYIPDDLSGYKVIRKGQFGMNKMKAWQGSYGVSDHTGIVSPAYFIFDFTKPVVPEYFHWAIRSKLYVSYFASASDGVRIGQWDLSKPRMKVIPFLVPSVEEQEAIAKFLDKKTAQIDQAINIKEQQITLLKERKQIIIQNAVTKGLDPNVPMKDSGVEWIGEIPAHWYLKPLTKEILVQEGPGIMAVDFHEEGVPLVRISGVKSETVTLDGCNYLKPSKVCQKWNHFKLNKGDLVISGSASTELVSEVKYEAEGAILYTGLIRVTPRSKNVIKEYLKVFFGTQLFFTQIDLQKTGSTISHYGPSHLSRMFILLPDLNEQKRIITYVNMRNQEIIEAIGLLEQQINNLNEYKASLINSAVTGKIKVI
jgi:type I restriction enzyme S subunit